MKQTVLEMTQSILSRMDSDEVTSITDTTESQQVAEVIRQCYFNIVSRANLPEHAKNFSLTDTNSTTPVLLTRPTDVARIDWIKYYNANTDVQNYEYVTILPFQQFLDMTQRVDPTETAIDTFTLDGMIYYYRNDGQPNFCTVLSNTSILFNSFDNTIDTTNLQGSKTLCYGLTVPTFTLADGFTPDLEDYQFPLLLAEATSQAFLELKQIANDVAVQESKRQWVNVSKTKSTKAPSNFDQLQDYGRNARWNRRLVLN